MRMSPRVDSLVQPTSRTVSSMPGIERAAPERTETSRGSRRSTQASAGLLLEEGDLFFQPASERTLGVLVALHHEGRQARWEAQRRAAPASQTRLTRQASPPGPSIVSGAAVFSAPAFDPHDAHGSVPGHLDSSPMTWVWSTWPIGWSWSFDRSTSVQARALDEVAVVHGFPPSTSSE